MTFAHGNSGERAPARQPAHRVPLSDLCAEAQLPRTPSVQVIPAPPTRPPQPQDLQRQAEKPGRPSPRGRPCGPAGEPLASRPPHGCHPTCSWSCRANSSTWNRAQSPGSCRLRALPARSQPSLGDAEQAIRCEIKGPPAPRPAAGPGPVRPALAAPPCLPGPGLSQAAHLPTFPPDETYPPSPNAPRLAGPHPSPSAAPCLEHPALLSARRQGSGVSPGRLRAPDRRVGFPPGRAGPQAPRGPGLSPDMCGAPGPRALPSCGWHPKLVDRTVMFQESQ